MMSEEEITAAVSKGTTVFYLSEAGVTYKGSIIRCPFGLREIYFKGSNGSEKKIGKKVSPAEIFLNSESMVPGRVLA
jgi:hypothetical protein